MPQMEEAGLFSIEVVKPPSKNADYIPEVVTSPGEPLPVVVDYERAELVIGRLLEAQANNQPPYGNPNTRLPLDERHMPLTLIRDSPAHAQLLFNFCHYMRGGIKTNDAVRRISAMFDSRPDFFDAELTAGADQADLIVTLKEHGLGFQKTNSRFWIENSRRLAERYDGDPRNIFDGVTNYEESVARVKNDNKGGGFMGFQEKMVSMLIYYLMHEDMIEPFNFPVPIDLHVLRVSVANELVTFPGTPHKTDLLSSELLAALRKLTFDYAEEHNVNPLVLSDAMWSLSETSCGLHPGNITLEPEGRKKRNGRATKLTPLPVDLTSPVQQRAYAAACAPCPVNDLCQWNVPGKGYYVTGALYIRGPRAHYPAPPAPLPETPTPVPATPLF